MIDAIRNVAQGVKAPSLQQAEAIVSFVALQHVRGPHVIEELNRFAVDASRLRLEMIARSPVAYATHGSEAGSRNQAPLCRGVALMGSAYHHGALAPPRVLH